MELQVFENSQFGTVRTLLVDTQPWFVAGDVCECLDISEPHRAIASLDDDETARHTMTVRSENGVEQKRDVSIISEPGLYSLVLRSRKPEAKAFKRWITHDVLPSIRKHGVYATEDFIQHSIDDPDWAISMLQQFKFEREQRKLMESQRDEAIRTKAQIGCRREATAMATASTAVRQRDKALEALGEGKTWKQVKAIPWLKDIFELTSAAYSQIGKRLVKLSADMGLDVKVVPSSEYGTVKCYHVDVIDRLHAMLSAYPEMMGKYRRA